jgi:hypothetical protein
VGFILAHPELWPGTGFLSVSCVFHQQNFPRVSFCHSASGQGQRLTSLESSTCQFLHQGNLHQLGKWVSCTKEIFISWANESVKEPGESLSGQANYRGLASETEDKKGVCWSNDQQTRCLMAMEDVGLKQALRCIRESFCAGVSGKKLWASCKQRKGEQGQCLGKREKSIGRESWEGEGTALKWHLGWECNLHAQEITNNKM